MPRIIVKPDSLDEQTVRFAPAPLTQPLFLNSLQKSGSHLLKNIIINTWLNTGHSQGIQILFNP